MKTIRILVTLFALLLTSVLADGASYNYSSLGGAGSVDWKIKTTTPPDGKGEASALFLGSCKGADCVLHGQSGNWAIKVSASGATWPYGWCTAEYDAATDTTSAYAIFKGEVSSWPATWPAALQCIVTGGGNTFTADINVVDAIETTRSTGTISSLPGSITVTIPAGLIGVSRVYTLPTGNYTSGCYQAKHNDGTTWPGVTCSVDENVTTADGLVLHAKAASGGTGYCKFNKDGVLKTLSVTVN